MLLNGCAQKDSGGNTYPVQHNVEKTETQNITNESVESDHKSISIGFINNLSTDIGMISVIDPTTDEQFNIDGIADGEMITVSSSMPNEVTNLEWAIYNKNGDLYSSSSTDISDANESVYIILCGDGALDDVKVVFDKTDDEVREAVQALNDSE